MSRYFNAVDHYSRTGQRFGWSDVQMNAETVNGTDVVRLSIMSTTVIAPPGNSGVGGAAATNGRTTGSYFGGYDFCRAGSDGRCTSSPASLAVEVDGANVDISLSTDLTEIEAGVVALNLGLGTAATATLDSSTQRITVTSATSGSTSMVRVDGSDSVAALMGFSYSLQVDGADNTAGTFIGERIPHRFIGASSPLRGLDPPGFAGFDFSTKSEQLFIIIDGTNHTIDLTSDLSDPANTVDAINTVLGAAGAAALDAEGRYMTITSASIGLSSTVIVDLENSGEKARQMLSPAIKSLLGVTLHLDRISMLLAQTFSDDIVYIVERENGLLIAESAGEGVTTSAGDRKCAVNSELDLLRVSALQLENMRWATASARIDNTHFCEKDLRSAISSIFSRSLESFGLMVDRGSFQTMRKFINGTRRTMAGGWTGWWSWSRL